MLTVPVACVVSLCYVIAIAIVWDPKLVESL